MRLACVVHRYGTDVTGGSEAHCRTIAEHLAERHDVTVLTTTAKNYVTWRNAYPAGETRVNGLRVVRFHVQRPRRLHEFRDLSDLVFTGAATLEEQARWFDENGPIVPGLIDHLTSGVPAYDRVLFWSYRYYPAFHGVQAVRDRAVLVPTAEEDPLIHAPILASYFAWPRAYLFLTPEERDLVASRLAGAIPPSAVIGAGLDPPAGPGDREALDAIGIPETFLLYVGRIERNKGCEILLRYFAAYLAGGRPPIPLVMAGPAIMPVPEHPLIHPLGYVPDTVRDALLAHARSLVVPSPYESLSMVLLEAWNRGTPALVNGRCRVLKGQVERADGGLHYGTAREFAEALELLVRDPALARTLGGQGRAYVDAEYRWGVVMQRIESLLAGN
jgi:glycosyltransferase involved in cell wall biosynthesis